MRGRENGNIDWKGWGRQVNDHWSCRVELEQRFGVGCAVKLATTGKAASVINGSTLHSRKNGLSVPDGTQRFTKMTANQLKLAQQRLKNVRLIIIDDYSMLPHKELYYIDQILRQISGEMLQLFR